MKAVNVYAILAGFALAQVAAAWFIHVPNARDEGRRAGYAAAVDSVRAANRHNEVASVLNLYEVPYDMVIWNRDRTDTACVIHMGVMK